MAESELLETRIDAVTHLTLNRPAAMNALTVSLAENLRNALVRLEDTARVVVLSGAGEHFCVGGDVSDLAALRDADGTAGVRRLLDAFGELCTTIERLRIPVIAAVRGYALAGGFELVQCCDIAIVAENARLGDHHLRMGVVPGGGSSQRLPRIAGRPRALGLMLTGDHLTASEAVAWGLAYRSVPGAKLDSEAAALAARLAERSPAAVAATKALVTGALTMPLAAGLEHERAVASAHLAADGAGLFSMKRGA